MGCCADVLLGADAHQPGDAHPRPGRGLPRPDLPAVLGDAPARRLGRRLPGVGAGRGPRPGARYRTSVAITAAWAVTVYAFNVAVDTNYGYLNAKPAAASALDLLGPWPWYVVNEIVIVAAFWALITWPWTRRAPERTADASPTRARPRALEPGHRSSASWASTACTPQVRFATWVTRRSTAVLASASAVGAVDVVQRLHPGQHRGQRVGAGGVEVGVEAEREQPGRRDGVHARHRARGLDVDDELGGHRALHRRPADLAVALGGVPVAEAQQRAGHLHRQVQRRAGRRARGSRRCRRCRAAAARWGARRARPGPARRRRGTVRVGGGSRATPWRSRARRRCPRAATTARPGRRPACG